MGELKVAEETIARKELFAALVGILCFHDVIERKLVRLHTDNENAFHWLWKSRSQCLSGTRFLAL